MANSGSFNTNPYKSSSDSPRYYTFSWSIISQSIEGNYTDISYSLVGAGGNKNTYWVEVKEKYVTVNGSTQSSSDIQTTYNGTVAFSSTARIYHNADGTGAFSASAGGAFYYYGSYNSTGSGTWDLPTIPRYTTVWVSERGKTVNSISVNWTTADPRDYTQYSLNGGAWQDAYDTVDSINKNGHYTISGLSPNTPYTVKTRCKRIDSQLWSESSALTITTYDIARIRTANDFNLGDEAAIEYFNPSGSNLEIGIYSTDGNTGYAPYRSCTGNNYTFTFTDAELDAIYKALGTTNFKEFKIFIRTAGVASYTDNKNITITLTGNQKTRHVNVGGEWQRAKRWIKVDGEWRRCVRWVNVDGTWRRTI